MTNRLSFVARCVGGVLAFAALGAAHAAEYPTRPLTLVVPYPPGASTDNLARAVADELGKELKQPVVVENKPGAATTIGIMAVKNPPADGYTIMFQTEGLIVGPYAVKNVDFKRSDFELISPLARAPFALMAPSSIPSDSVEEYFKYARDNPEKMNYGVLGAGLSIFTLLGDAVTESTGIRWTSVPYKGGMEGIQALMSDQIQAYFATVSLASSQLKQPRLKVIAVADTKRSPYLPDVPTFAEAGYPEIVGAMLLGLGVRAETPPEIVEKLKAAMERVRASETMKKSIASLSLESYEGSLQDYEKDLDELAELYAAAAKKLEAKAAN